MQIRPEQPKRTKESKKINIKYPLDFPNTMLMLQTVLLFIILIILLF